MKMKDLKAGDIVVVDGGFTCIDPGRKCDVKRDGDGLYIECRGPDGLKRNKPYHEKHHLDGQIGKGGELIGLSRP